jgi:hypothetical protein
MSVQPDTLSRKELAQSYGYALRVIYSVPELRDLFERAVNAEEGQYTAQRFQAELQNTTWYQENDQYFRKAWAAEQMGGADWTADFDEAKMAVQAVAAQMGADVTPEELDALARRYIYEGWGTPARQGMLAQALSEEIAYLPTEAGGQMLRGAAGTFTDNLKAMSLANGLQYNDDWYLSAAKSVASGLTTEADWERDMRQQAASMFPTYAEQISAGMNALDIASPFINVYAQTMERSPYEIGLDNPDIRRAMMDGMGIFDFQQMLREKPEWINTKQGEDRVSEISLRVMKMFGLVG